MSKTKTFEAETEFSEVIDWFNEQIETKDHEIITNTPPDYDVEVRTVKKYKITIYDCDESEEDSDDEIRQDETVKF